jgi:hypothetical protein
MKKKVLLFVIDALADLDVRRKLSNAELPHLAELIRDRGELSVCTSIFPSITPAATCSIVTGQYPAAHGIQGAYWFDCECDEYAYFGDDLRLISKEGFENYLVDFGERLNAERLRSKTLFEFFAEQRISSGCINFMWYKGNTLHQRRPPWLLRMITGELNKQIYGPEVFKLGDFVETWPPGMQPPTLSGGLLHKFGFTDEASMGAVAAMFEQDCLPEFTLVYLPGNDDLAHDIGPRKAADQVLTRFDAFLGRLAETAGGWESLRQQYVILLVGDHAQSFLLDDLSEREIDPAELLKEFSLGNAGCKSADADLFVCANMRSAAIYQLGNDRRTQQKIIATLLQDPRIDQVIWQDPHSPADKSHVKTAAGELAFWRTPTEGSRSVRDNFGNHWLYDGQLKTLDLRVEDGQLIDGRYPNAFERIASAFISTEAKPLWATAKEGYEFSTTAAHVSARGSHGSLSAADSNSCLVSSEPIPGRLGPMRIIDVFGVCATWLVSHHA